MALALALFCLAAREDPLRVDGPPFLVFGESMNLQAVTPLKEVDVVWRLVEAPPGAIETQPSMDPSTRVIRGPAQISVASVGTVEGEVRFAVTLERKRVRLACADFRARVGPLVRIKTWCRVVDHRRGGTGRAEAIRDPAELKALQEDVSRLLHPLGIGVELALGSDVRAPDAWFDAAGGFHPIVLKDGKRANSPALRELTSQDEAGGLNVYFVRDCVWITTQEGFERVVTDHHLIGVGLKDGEVVLDDAWDAPSLAHELGHALGLDDLKDASQRSRLMYWIRRDRTAALFTYPEMKDAREAARQHLRSWLARR